LTKEIVGNLQNICTADKLQLIELALALRYANFIDEILKPDEEITVKTERMH